ncbi:hypothetical protein D1871_04710 [Nakamurella silvestris]|nr:hypothetical protein D1871_04710 [Nakamurella silvestris]
MIALSTVFFVPSAQAAEYNSPFNVYGPVLGYNYKNQSTAYNTAPYQAWGRVRTADSSVLVPPGYMGAQVTLYRNGVRCRTAAMNYSQYNNNAWNVYTTGGTCGTGVYYAKGSTAAYNGNGYNTYYTAQSPSFNG